ncbi:Putative Zinc finger C2H2-type, transcription factor Grauzone [Colletotrichum destructivum]|uniref:Zinc finger C2H2-type, transcription factor Grauzone n=1 Tax=Colletotrichum destructivum TaxID=34406 RepID=A0AAX4IZS3_9PEZI|nr:Putative Zinc finger C2H2-type, transcription factor Grauzone [Colletotrichum destructivum]
MAYFYEHVQGGHLPDEQLYYGHQNFSQMPMSFLESSSSSDSSTPVDPSFASYPPEPQYQTPWPVNQTHQIQQYMEGPRTAFFVPEYAQVFHNIARPTQESTTLPPASQRRHGSPCSQQTLSSSDSNSPPTESDVLPATPPDCSATSPFMQHKQYTGDWETQQYRSHTLLGLGKQGTVFVNPHEVNISQAIFEEEAMPTPFDHSRTFSFCCSDSDESSIPQQSAFSSREMTPEALEPIVKKELPTAEPSYQQSYPEPELSEQDSLKSTTKIEPLISFDDTKDSDYRPEHHTRKRSRNTHARQIYSPGSTQERKRPRVNSDTGGLAPSRLNAPIHSARNPKIVCTECKTPFSDESTYQKHMKQHHTRPFACIFNYAGCPSTFASKNEWKRHVSSQHLALQYWLCVQDGCSKTTNPPTNRRFSSSSSCSVSPTPPALPNGAIFNRKDLYTQHVRRMHVPPHVRKAQKLKKPTPEWDDHLKDLQAEAEQTRCDLPQYMRCPAGDCGHEFNGPQAWDERMEHVARHLERAADGKEPTVHFGGETDPTLTQWASSPGVYVVRQTDTPGNWELINPLKGEIGPSSGNGKGGNSGGKAFSSLKEIVVAACSDEDAEGEEEE